MIKNKLDQIYYDVKKDYWSNQDLRLLHLFSEKISRLMIWVACYLKKISVFKKPLKN